MGSVAASLVGQAALVVTGVIVARALGPTDRGHLALLLLLPSVLLQVGTLGLPLATTYFIAREPAHELHVRRSVARPAIVQLVVLTLVQAGVLWLLVRGEPTKVEAAAAVSLALLTGALANMYGKALLQGQRRYRPFNILRNDVVGFYLAGVLVLVVAGRVDLVAVSVAWVAANLLAGALTLAIAVRPHPPVPQQGGPALREMTRFGLRGWLGSLSPVTTFRLDQAVVGLFLAPQALGLYVAALAFTNLPSVISRGVAMIALPQMARPGRGGGEVRSFVLLTVVLTGGVVVGLALLAGWLVPLFFGEDFEPAVTSTRILLVGSFFYGVRRVLTDAVSGAGRPGLGSLAELSSWIVLVPLLALFAPRWGIEGVAAALAASYAASLGVFGVLLRGPALPGPGPAQMAPDLLE